MRRSRSAGQAHPADGFLVATLALATAALLFSLCLGSTPAAADPGVFRSCTTQKLENQGILKLSAKHVKGCRLARQVAYARLRGDKTPKGFLPLILCRSEAATFKYQYSRPHKQSSTLALQTLITERQLARPSGRLRRSTTRF